MKYHPEQLDDEVYMGNSIGETWRLSWRTSRLGFVAFDIDSHPIKETQLRPWFVKVSEVQAKIDSVRLENRPWSADTIRALQPMVDHRTVFTDRSS